jgi:surface antigen
MLAADARDLRRYSRWSTSPEDTLMRILPIRSLSALLSALTLLVPTLAHSSVYGFLDQGAMRYFEGEDAVLMSAAIDAALANPSDNETQSWRNDATGSHGSVTVLQTFTDNGRHCRRIEIQNHAGGMDGQAIADMCQVDGVWKVLRMPE